jgi:hypothetical protein
MNHKLTLSINNDVIQKAKEYAKKNNISLSFLIENYLLKISSELQETSTKKVSLVNELSGIIKLDDDFNYKEAHSNYLIEKYK